MHIRVLTGRYAGEIRDIRSDAAKQMLADDRAEDPEAPKVFADFHSGGMVEGGTLVLVGEHVSDHVLPRALVDKLEAAASAASTPSVVKQTRQRRQTHG